MNSLEPKAAMPWTPLRKELKDCRIALITTAGVHLRTQAPFDMKDDEGDPSFRPIPSSVSTAELTITHDYYDHSDADRDIGVIFPYERLRELVQSGFIGSVAANHFGLMGHIYGCHLKTLVGETAERIASALKADSVDAVVISPG